MKVLNLRCARDHRFEGWFASEEDFVSQGERGLLTCPICSDGTVTRLPSAPRINVSRHRAQDDPSQDAPGAAARVTQAQGQWLQAVRELLRNTEDVGDRFAEEARRIHYGESQERGIRGRTSREEAAALRDEGIEVLAVALPDVVKDPMQ